MHDFLLLFDLASWLNTYPVFELLVCLRNMKQIHDGVQPLVAPKPLDFVPCLLLKTAHHSQCIFKRLGVIPEIRDCISFERGRRRAFVQNI